MRLLKFLAEQNVVQKALKIDKPDSSEEYTENEVNSALTTLSSALKNLRAKGSDESKAAAKDVAAKLRAWVNFAKENFKDISAIDAAQKQLSGKTPKRVSAPVSPDSPLPVDIAMKAGTLPADPDTIKDLDNKKEKEEEE